MRVRGRWAPVPDDYTYPPTINGMAVVSAPAEIDICDAEQLRIVLREAGRRGHVVDMTGTRFCDSEGFSVLVGVHKWGLAEGGGLRLVIPPGSPVLRIFRAIGLGRFIPRFGSLEQALAPGPAAERRAAGTANPTSTPGWPGSPSGRTLRAGSWLTAVRLNWLLRVVGVPCERDPRCVCVPGLQRAGARQ